MLTPKFSSRGGEIDPSSASVRELKLVWEKNFSPSPAPLLDTRREVRKLSKEATSEELASLLRKVSRAEADVVLIQEELARVGKPPLQDTEWIWNRLRSAEGNLRAVRTALVEALRHFEPSSGEEGGDRTGKKPSPVRPSLSHLKSGDEPVPVLGEEIS